MAVPKNFYLFSCTFLSRDVCVYTRTERGLPPVFFHDRAPLPLPPPVPSCRPGTAFTDSNRGPSGSVRRHRASSPGKTRSAATGRRAWRDVTLSRYTNCTVSRGPDEPLRRRRVVRWWVDGWGIFFFDFKRAMVRLDYIFGSTIIHVIIVIIELHGSTLGDPSAMMTTGIICTYDHNDLLSPIGHRVEYVSHNVSRFCLSRTQWR